MRSLYFFFLNPRKWERERERVTKLVSTMSRWAATSARDWGRYFSTQGVALDSPGTTTFLPLLLLLGLLLLSSSMSMRETTSVMMKILWCCWIWGLCFSFLSVRNEEWGMRKRECVWDSDKRGSFGQYNTDEWRQSYIWGPLTREIIIYTCRLLSSMIRCHLYKLIYKLPNHYKESKIKIIRWCYICINNSILLVGRSGRTMSAVFLLDLIISSITHSSWYYG